MLQDYNDEIRQEQMWEIQVMNTQRGGKGELLVGDSTASSSSTGSMSPCTPPLPVAAESPPPHPAMHGLVLPPQHPALRGLEPRTSIAAANITPVGKKSLSTQKFKFVYLYSYRNYALSTTVKRLHAF